HDRTTGLQAARERDEIHLWTLHKRRPHRVTRAQHEVHHPWWRARLLEELHQLDGGQGGDLAGLEDHRVARRQRGGHLPRHLQQRVVPRRDQRADTHRFVHHAAAYGRLPRIDESTGVGFGLRGVVLEHRGDIVHV